VPRTLIDERYELRDPLGSGGMADVYLAHDNVLDRDVALKLLKEHYAHDEEFVERFKREAQSAAALSHPNIVSIFDRGESEDGTYYYIAMEYLPGATLKDHILKRGALSPQIAVEVALQSAQALQAAHKRGIIHRDIKPHNILITDSGDVKVTDFGIARAADATTTTSSHLGDILGTAKYMSPEQAMGEPVGPESDLYSLGVVLYEMLTARVPYEGSTPEEVSAKHAGEPPPHPKELNPKVPKGMDALVMKLLSREPAERYGGSAEELIEDLRRVRDGLPALSRSAEKEATTAALGTPPTPALPPGAPGGGGAAATSRPPERRRRLSSWTLLMAFVALIALLGVVGGAVGWSLWQDRNEGGVPGGGAHKGAGRKPSGPPQEAKVPDVEGMSERAARERLAGAGFEAEIRPREVPVEDAGRVLKQSVSGGKEAKEGSKILLSVGQAPEVAEVPKVVGLSYPEAESALQESGFLLGGVKEEWSNTVPEGVIMKQDPQPGTTLEPNSYVYLTTSVGPPEGGGAGGR
jgi:eukaryotic-like serine/threonine-protein kinase